MRIALLTSSLPPHPIGGAEHQALDTARRLAARGHRVTVYARRLPPSAPRRIEEDGVTWIRSPVVGAVPLPGLRFASHVASFLGDWLATRGSGYDVILAYQMLINGYLGSLVESRKAPLVTWIRCESEGFAFRGRASRLAVRRVMNRSRRLLFQDEAIRRPVLSAAARAFGARLSEAAARRSEILPNAITLEPEPERTSRGGLVFLGRLTRQKGLDLLLEALRSLESPPPLRVVGGGPDREELERAAQGLPVTFVGRVPEDRVRTEISGARALVFPSRWEGFPNAVLEAMERGLPVIGADVGAVRTLVRDGETGYLVPPEDPGALAAALRRFLADPGQERAMSLRARETAARYGWDSHLDRLESILASATEQPA